MFSLSLVLDTPNLTNLGFPYLNFLGAHLSQKTPKYRPPLSQITLRAHSEHTQDTLWAHSHFAEHSEITEI